MLIAKTTLDKKFKIAIFIVLFLCFISPPLLAVDTTAYALNAEVIYTNIQNPYTTPLNAATVPKELSDVWWMALPSPYGPAFLLITFIPWLISFSSLFAFIYAYKLFALVAFLASAWLFSKLRQRENAPAYLDLLFILNPALIINLVLEGHNEVFIILFLLLFLYTSDKPLKKLGYMTMAVLIKFSTFLAWPLIWFKNSKFNLKSFVKSNIFLLIIGLIFFKVINLLPQDFLKQNVLFINNACFYKCSPIYSLGNHLPNLFGDYFKIITFLLAYLFILYWFLIKRYEPLKFIVWSFVALFFITTKWLTPWYPTIIIPFSLLLNNKKYLLISALITAYCLLHYILLI
ncbi:MAG: polyprenol phosphomannose-dependent alpha 1,6 mannosyltransferase MptB [Candidatus Falkowbacteria bacterium]|nr:polyprenol phosphomannose-dependent alpha 1,6 mannosyltransferase MptB [Candidatus Falkowbacteria bacterium]